MIVSIFLPDRKVLAKESSSCPATDRTSTIKRMMLPEAVLSIIFNLFLIIFYSYFFRKSSRKIGRIVEKKKERKKRKKKEKEKLLPRHWIDALFCLCGFDHVPIKLSLFTVREFSDARNVASWGSTLLSSSCLTGTDWIEIKTACGSGYSDPHLHIIAVRGVRICLFLSLSLFLLSLSFSLSFYVVHICMCLYII